MTNDLDLSQISRGNFPIYNVWQIMLHSIFTCVLLFFVIEADSYHDRITASIVTGIVFTNLLFTAFDRKRKAVRLLFLFISLSLPSVIIIALSYPGIKFEALLLFIVTIRAMYYSAYPKVMLSIKFLVITSIALTAHELAFTPEIPSSSELLSKSLLLFFLSYLAIHVFELFNLKLGIQHILEKYHDCNIDIENILSRSYEPVAVYDYKEDRLVKVNDVFIRMIGYNIEELNAMSVSGYRQLMSNDDSVDQYEQVKEELKFHEMIGANSMLISKFNERIYFESLLVPSETNNSLYFIILQDKTLEVTKNEQLRSSIDTYQKMFDNNHLGVILLDEAGLSLETNESYGKFIKREQTSLYGSSIYDYVHIQDRDRFKNKFIELKNNDIESFTTDIKMIDEDGDEFMAYVSVNSIRKNDEFTSAIATISNITNQKEAELKLKSSEHRYKSVFKNSLGGIAIIKNREFVEVNEAFLKIINAEKDEVIGRDPEDFLYKEDKEYVMNQLFKPENNDLVNKQVIHRIIFKDRIRHVAGHLSLLSEEDSTFLLSCIDVTALLTAQLSLTNYTTTLDTVIYNAPDSIIALNNDFEIMVMNDKAREILSPFIKPGFNLEIGSNFIETVDKNYFRQCSIEPYSQVLSGDAYISDVSIETTIDERKFNRKLSPLINSTEQVIGCVEMLSDITEAKRKEAQIELGRKKYKDIFDNSYEGILLVDYYTTNIIDGNHRMVTMLGLNPEESLSNYSVNDFIHHEQLDKVSKSQLITILANQIISNDKVTRILTGSTVDGKEFIASITVIKDFNDDKKQLVFFIDDVSDEYTYKLELEHSNQLYTSLFNYSFDGIDILELKTFNFKNKSYDAVLLSRNKKGTALIGDNDKTYLYAEEIQPMLYNEVSLLQITKKLNQSFTELFTKGFSKTRWIIKDLDNRKRYVDFSVNMVVINNKKLLVRMTNDMTEQLEAIEEVSKSEQRYRRLINTLPGGVLQCDQFGKIGYISNGAAMIMGYEKFDLIGRSILEIITDKYRKLFEGYIADSMLKDQMEIITIEINQEDGGVVYIDVRAKMSENNDDGNHMIITFYESTGRVIAEQARISATRELDQRNVLYKTMIESSLTGIDVIKLDNGLDLQDQSRLLIRNSKMREIIGDDLDLAIESKSLSCDSTYLSESKSEKYAVPQHNSFINREASTYDHTLRLGGQKKYLEVMNSFVEVDDQRLLVRHILDVTDRRKKDAIIHDQLAELNNKNDELEKYIESNLQLENFAYIASHDLKAPLRTVSSFAYLLKKKAYKDLDDKSKKYLDIIVASSNNMQILINDLLQFARMNTDKLHISEVNLSELLKRCRSELSETIQKTGATLSVSNIPETIYADEIKLGQLLQNLIRNGIKFVRAGIKPIVKIECHERVDEWVFSVNDNGIGIKEEHKSKIFGIFEKLHSNDVYEGTGLGLTICKKVVEKHQGKIWLESEEGVGTTFFFTIKKNIHPLVDSDKPEVSSIDRSVSKEAVVA